MPLPFDLTSLKRDDLRDVGLGGTSEVVHIANTNVAAKIPALSRMFGPEVHQIEKKSSPECKLFRGVLLFECNRRGTLIDCLNQLKAIPGRSRWPYQAVSAVAYILSRGVVHADLGLHNFLLHDNGRIVLCDVAGSGLDGDRSYVAHGVRYASPLSAQEYRTEQEDIFALGTVLYELDRGGRLFEEMSREEIYVGLRDRQFPDLSMVSLPLRGAIEKCWTVPRYKASYALKELEPQPLAKHS